MRLLSLAYVFIKVYVRMLWRGKQTTVTIDHTTLQMQDLAIQSDSVTPDWQKLMHPLSPRWLLNTSFAAFSWLQVWFFCYCTVGPNLCKP